MDKKRTKDLNYYKNNCEEDYIKTPISVRRYIIELEQKIKIIDKKRITIQSLIDKSCKSKSSKFLLYTFIIISPIIILGAIITEKIKKKY